MVRKSMASRLTVTDVLDRLDEDDGDFSADESDCEEEGIVGYLPEVSGSFWIGDEDGEGQFEDAQEGDEDDAPSGGPGSSDPGKHSPTQ